MKMSAGRGRLSLAVVLAVTVAVMFHSAAEAATYVVGDAMGWVVPADDDAYDNWALRKNFTVGDVLVFNFTTGRSDVAQVSEQGEDDCNGTRPIRRATIGPANMTLTTAGRNYFISTIAGQCNAGQRLDINVLQAPPTAPARAPAPANTTGPSALPPSGSTAPGTPAASSATSGGVAGVFTAALLTVVSVALLF